MLGLWCHEVSNHAVNAQQRARVRPIQPRCSHSHRHIVWVAVKYHRAHRHQGSAERSVGKRFTTGGYVALLQLLLVRVNFN